MFDIRRQELSDIASVTYLGGIWRDGGYDAHKLPEIEPESVTGHGVRVQIMVILYNTSLAVSL